MCACVRIGRLTHTHVRVSKRTTLMRRAHEHEVLIKSLHMQVRFVYAGMWQGQGKVMSTCLLMLACMSCARRNEALNGLRMQELLESSEFSASDVVIPVSYMGLTSRCACGGGGGPVEAGQGGACVQWTVQCRRL